MAQDVTKIVITGGPGAGKSSVMPSIKKHFEKRGYRVLNVAETATELINSGIAPWTCPSQKEFQDLLLDLQLDKEKAYDQFLKFHPDEKILVIYDRGSMDNQCYVSDEVFDQILGEKNLKKEDLYNRYDGIFHLECPARRFPEDYTVDNNLARKEDPELAARLDERIEYIWSQHPEYHQIPANKSFKKKVKETLHTIEDFLEKRKEPAFTEAE